MPTIDKKKNTRILIANISVPEWLNTSLPSKTPFFYPNIETLFYPNISYLCMYLPVK
jgi:hypothetical protein